MGEVGKALTRKLGPAPAWVWLSLFAVVMVVLRLVRRPSPASTAGEPLQSSGPLVPVNIGPVRETSSTKVQTVIWRPPLSPLPKPANLSKKAGPAFDALIAWWQGGGTGMPPDASGVHLSKKDRASYESQLQWYQANPYSFGTKPPDSTTETSSQVYDPTTDSYAL